MTWHNFISQIINECAQDPDKLTKYAGPLEKNIERTFENYRTHLNPNPTPEAIQAFANCKRYAQETTLCAKLQQDTTLDEIKALIADNPERKKAIPLYESYSRDNSKETLKEILAGLATEYDKNLDTYKKGKKPITQSIEDTLEILESAYHKMKAAVQEPLELYHFYSKGLARDTIVFLIALKVKYTPDQARKVQTTINLIGELEQCGKLFDIDKLGDQKVQYALDRIEYLAEQDKKRGYAHDEIRRKLEEFNLQHMLEKPEKERILPLRQFLQEIALDIVATYERVIKDIKKR